MLDDFKVHDEIMKRGLIRSVVNYFKNQNNTNNVDLAKMDAYCQDLRKLYFDYYRIIKFFKLHLMLEFYNNIFHFCACSEKGLCNENIPLTLLLVKTFQPDVASVDFLPELKNLPYGK